MEKKITSGIFFCTLFLITSLSLAACADFKEVIKEVATFSYNDEADVPTWMIGDSWTYDIELIINLDSDTSVNLSLKDMEFTVVSDSFGVYRLEYEGDVVGNFSEVLPFQLEDAEIEGYIEVEKSNLGIKKIFAHIDAVAEIIRIPVKADATLISEPAFAVLNFPLYAGKNWNTSLFNVSVRYEMRTIFGISESGTENVVIEEEPLNCTAKEFVTVAAGTYEAFKIKDRSGQLDIYYAPAAANVVKVIGSGPGQFGYVDMELKSSTYGSSGAPRKPCKPSGPPFGKADVTYEYSTNTTDPENDQIYYWFDWGDGTNSGWIGPFDSGELATANHSWSEDGSYKIMVKAKDINDLESGWSDPLEVMIGDDKKPIVEITKPKRYRVYYNNKKIAFIPFVTIVIGYLDIEVNATDGESGMNRVEFYINDDLYETDTDVPYTCGFAEPPGIYTITATAYDNAGNSASDNIRIVKLP
jgi:hypothetical protein